MKTRKLGATIASMALAGLMFVACRGWTPDRCAQQAKIYEDYLAAVQSGEILTQEQIGYARLAVQILNISCNWIIVMQEPDPTMPPALRKQAQPVVDKNGVPLAYRVD